MGCHSFLYNFAQVTFFSISALIQSIINVLLLVRYRDPGTDRHFSVQMYNILTHLYQQLPDTVVFLHGDFYFPTIN